MVLEAEVILNNRPLGYVEDDIQYHSFPPNMLIFRTHVTLSEDPIDSDPDFKQKVLSKMLKHIQTC